MYDVLARFYDTIHAELSDDVPLVLALAQAAAGPVLELGCGTGRLLLPLARAGHTVVGVDASAAMLARAADRLRAEPPAVQARARLVSADMVTLTLPPPPFALAVAGYNTVLHLDAPRLVSALHAVARHLRPDGTLLIDCDNPFWLADAGESDEFELEREWVDAASGRVLRQWSHVTADAAAAALHVTWRFDSADGSDGPWLAHDTYYYHFPHQLQTVLDATGFRVEALWGDYARGPFDEESERLIIVARRR